MRVTLDTNVWVSGFLSRRGAPARAIRQFLDGQFTLVTSEPLLAELLDVLSRPRLAARTGLANADLLDLLDTIREMGEVIEIAGEVKVCRDPDDDMVIETAIEGRADVIVSGDKDLTEDANVADALDREGIRVVSVAQFLTEMENE